MARQTCTIYYYSNINLPRDYSNVCDTITLSNLESYLQFVDTEVSVITHDLTGGGFKIMRTMQQLSYINYIAIIDNAGDRSPIFAFVDNCDYITDQTSQVRFTIDLWTTYCQSLDYQDCYIKRMTTSDDTMYKYLEDEPVNGGDYVTNPNQIMREYITEWNYGYTAITTESGSAVDGSVVDNVFTAATFYGQNAYGPIVESLQQYNANGYIDNICNVFQYPRECGTSGNKVSYESAVAFPNAVDNYTPKNRKLFNYPYVKGLIISSSGEVLEVKPQMCQNNEIRYHIDKMVIPLSQFVITLDNYKNLSYNDQKAQRIIMTGFPEVIWASDNYRAWLARNKPSLDKQAQQTALNVASGFIGAQIAGGTAAATAAAITSGAVNTINYALNRREQDESAQIQAQTIHGGGNLGVDVANGHFGFTIMIETIDARRASLIDNYFNAYGYAINKTSYFSPSRQRFDYVETSGNLFRRKASGGGVPNIALDTMNGAANRGLRIWHSLSELNTGNLVNSNPIV